MSVGTLLSMPRAKGLFRRAIAQSGAADRVVSADVALRIGRELAERLGVPATRDAIAAVPSDRLLAAQAELKADMLAHPDPTRWGTEVVASALPWQPVIDGDVIPEHPIDLIAAGAAADVDIIVGSNTEDWQLFAVTNGIVGQVTDEILTGAVADHGYRALAAYGMPPDETLAAYRAAHPGADGGQLLSTIQTDWWCRIPAMRLADAHAPVARPRTCTSSPGPRLWRTACFGACHALEIGFVFDTLDKGPNQMLGPLLGIDPPQPLADRHARSMGRLRGDRGPRLAEVRVRIEGRPFASMWPRGSWMILDHPSGRYGNGCGSHRSGR